MADDDRTPRRPRERDASRPDRNPLGGRMQRGTNIAKLSASTGAGFVASRVKGLRDGDLADQRFHAETADKVLELLGSMKGAAMKLGQIASFVDLDLPPEVQATYHEALAELRSAAPPVDAEAIAGVVAEEFGARPEQVFARWDVEPLASASIGQVHRAALPDGTEVAVKVQYPGVAEAVESDLANVEAFAPMAKLISPNLQVRPLMEEMRLRLVDELDYQKEAQYQHAFFERYDGHPFIAVPEVFHDYCRPRVLTTRYLPGVDFETALEAPEELRQHYGEVIFRFVFGSIHRFRLFNADPHPGNYLFREDGTVTFLDFGSVKLFRSAVRDAIRDQMRAVFAGDPEALLESMASVGFIPRGHRTDGELLMDWMQLFNRAVLHDEVFAYTPEHAREVIRSTTDPRAGYVDLLRKLNLPPDYLLLNRIQWGVNSILGRLGASGNWHRIMREFWGELPPQTELGRREHDFVTTSAYRA